MPLQGHWPQAICSQCNKLIEKAEWTNGAQDYHGSSGWVDEDYSMICGFDEETQERYYHHPGTKMILCGILVKMGVVIGCQEHFPEQFMIQVTPSDYMDPFCYEAFCNSLNIPTIVRRKAGDRLESN